MSAPTYHIRTVSDFLEVPHDRRHDCLHEFNAWLAMGDAARSIVEGINAKFPETFVWVDDGLRRLEATFVTSDGQRLPFVSGQIKYPGDGR